MTCPAMMRFTAAQAGFFILRWTWLNKKPAGLKLRRAAFRAFRSVADVDPIIAGPNNAGVVVVPASETKT